MTFEEWLKGTRGAVGSEIPEYMAKWAWEAAWDQQQRVIDEMHLMFKDRVLVPVEPTTRMVAIGRKVIQEADIWEVYKAMIQAAQEEE